VIAPHRLAPRSTATRRPLPARDPSIDALSPDERAIAAATWHGRAESELRASGSFAYIAGVLAEAGAPGELVALARRAIHDERRHAMICWYAACAYAGHALPEPRRLPLAIPRLPRASAELRRVLHVIGMCCLNETTANAFHELCRDGARAPLATAVLHELACDEVDHARLGWAFAAGPAVDAATRRELAGWLPELLAGNVAAWRERPRRAISDALVAHGCPRWDDVDRVVIAAIDDLLLPGFADIGIDVAPARNFARSLSTG